MTMPPPKPNRPPLSTSHNLKILFRCWAAAWTATLLIFIPSSLHSLGSSAFFAPLVLYIVPPATIFLVYLLAAFSLLLGMCLSWAWGLLSLKLALLARSSSKTHARFAEMTREAANLAEMSDGRVTVQQEVGKLVHDGFMLDARATVVMYVMCAVFIYTMARMRCANAKFVLMQLLGTIVIDLFLLFGPSLPAYNASLASALVKPGAAGVALGVACSILLFPDSTSYVVLDKLEALIRLADGPLDWTRRKLRDEARELDGKELTAAKDEMVTLYKSMLPAIGFLPLDISRGRLSAGDVMKLQDAGRKAVIASVFLLEINLAIISSAESHQKRMNATTSTSTSGSSEKKMTQQQQDLLEAMQSNETTVMRPQTMKALERNTSDLLKLCSKAIDLVAQYIHINNTNRWINPPSQHVFSNHTKLLQDTSTHISSSKAICAQTTTEAVLQSHADLFDPTTGHLKPSVHTLHLKGIVIAMVVEEHILNTAEAMQDLLRCAIDLAISRTRYKIWPPSRLQYAKSWLLNSKSGISVSGKATDPVENPDDIENEQPMPPKEDFESSNETNHSPTSSTSSAFQSANTTHTNYKPPLPPITQPKHNIKQKTLNFLFNTSGIYALQLIAVTIATSLPSSFPHSAGFFYREKGIWGVITAQTTLPVYAADLTISVTARLVGTLVGGIMGLAAWYIGSGAGDGNPYGMAAVTGVMTVVLVWWRVFLPPAFSMATVMCGVTFILVVGFSYDEHHIAQDGLPGVGYRAFWKRVVTVLLGFSASVVVQLFPRPPSARRHVRRTLACAVGKLSGGYYSFLTHWGMLSSSYEEEPGRMSLEVAEMLVSLEPRIKLIKVEARFLPWMRKAKWTADGMQAIQKHCQLINQSLTRLLRLSSTLDMDLQNRLITMTGMREQNTTTDIIKTLEAMVESLRNKAALPSGLPRLLDNTLATYSKAGDESTVQLSTDMVRDESYRRYCVALSSYLRFLGAVDDCVGVLREIVGEERKKEEVEGV